MAPPISLQSHADNAHFWGRKKKKNTHTYTKKKKKNTIEADTKALSSQTHRHNGVEARSTAEDNQNNREHMLPGALNVKL